MKTFLAFFATVSMLPVVWAQTDDPPVELGQVDWGRDLNSAQNESAESGKPILILFQEVPG